MIVDLDSINYKEGEDWRRRIDPHVWENTRDNECMRMCPEKEFNWSRARPPLEVCMEIMSKSTKFQPYNWPHRGLEQKHANSKSMKRQNAKSKWNRASVHCMESSESFCSILMEGRPRLCINLRKWSSLSLHNFYPFTRAVECIESQGEQLVFFTKEENCDYARSELLTKILTKLL